MALVDDLISVLQKHKGSAQQPKDKSNIPGFNYALRVYDTWYRALLANTKELNDIWPEIKSGNFGVGGAITTWANMLERSANVIIEATRGPGYVQALAWVVFDYVEGSTLDGGVALDPSTSEALFEATGFTCLGVGNAIADAYHSPPVAVRSEIRFRLNPDRFKNASPGHYLSFIFPKAGAPRAPLVVVVVRKSA